MRYRLALLLPALLAATAAAAPDTGAFYRKCRTLGPMTKCNCIAAELLRTRRGRMAIDGLRVAELPFDRIKPLAAELTAKYGLTLPELTVEMRASQDEVLAAGRKCP